MTLKPEIRITNFTDHKLEFDPRWDIEEGRIVLKIDITEKDDEKAYIPES